MHKVCPHCKNLNSVSSMFCSNPKCGFPLINVSLSEDDKNSPAINNDQNQQNEVNANIPFTKECPKCHHQWPAALQNCPNCNVFLQMPKTLADSVQDKHCFDNSAEIGSRSGDKEKTSFVLRSEDGFCLLEIKENDDYVIGRDDVGSDYLENKSFVSRHHLRIQQKTGEVIITHIAQTNPTLLDGKALAKDVPTVLRKGDLLALGAQEGQGLSPDVAYFRLFISDEIKENKK